MPESGTPEWVAAARAAGLPASSQLARDDRAPHLDSRSTVAVERPAVGRVSTGGAELGVVPRHAAPDPGRPDFVGPIPFQAGSPASPRKRGVRWPLLADDLFRLAHRDTNGGPLLHPTVAGLGLAAALLGELVLTNKVGVQGEYLVVLSRDLPDDALAHLVLDQLLRESQPHPVRTWLAYLAQTSNEGVADRLRRAGHVRAEVSRRLLAKTTVYVPTDVNTAAWPWARLSTRLRTRQRLDPFDVVLAGLMLAVDLQGRVLDGASHDIVAGLREVIASTELSTRLLLHHAEAAIGDAVVTNH